MPADAGIDQRRSGLHHGSCQLQHLVPTAAVGDQIEHRQAINDDEVRPDRLAHSGQDLHGQTHPVGIAAAPVVAALIGMGDQELVQKITFRAHHLDAVIAGFARQLGAANEGADLPFDAARRQLARREGRNRRLDSGGRDAKGLIAIAAGVQDLQGDLAAFGMDGPGDGLMPSGRATGGQGAGKRLGPAFDIRRETAGDDQPDLAARALGEVDGHPFEMFAPVFKPGMHAAHQYAVLQGGETEVKRFEQMRIGHGCGC